MKLWDIAHSRTGDKGNISNVSLIAYDPKDFEMLREKVTAEKVKEHFKGMVHGDVVRYELPNIHALNFVMYAALGGVHCASHFFNYFLSLALPVPGQSGREPKHPSRSCFCVISAVQRRQCW